MKTVAISDLQDRWTEFAREVEDGETITVTRDGRPVFDLVPRPHNGRVNFEAGRAYLAARGITNPVPYIAPDFDDPLPEDFLLHPLPPDA